MDHHPKLTPGQVFRQATISKEIALKIIIGEGEEKPTSVSGITTQVHHPRLAALAAKAGELAQEHQLLDQDQGYLKHPIPFNQPCTSGGLPPKTKENRLKRIAIFKKKLTGIREPCLEEARY